MLHFRTVAPFSNQRSAKSKDRHSVISYHQEDRSQALPKAGYKLPLNPWNTVIVDISRVTKADGVVVDVVVTLMSMMSVFVFVVLKVTWIHRCCNHSSDNTVHSKNGVTRHQ